MKALLLVDIQNDFLDGGALAVPDGRAVIPIANRLLHRFDVVVATQDWHPANHLSFASQHSGLVIGDRFVLDGLPQTAWPDHCVQGTYGAELSQSLDQRRISHHIRKGTQRTVDSYSGFFDNGHRQATGLEQFLRQCGVTDVYVMGLATDYCVKFTALDSARLGFKTLVILDGCRGVELASGDVQRSVEEMRSSGIAIIKSTDVPDCAANEMSAPVSALNLVRSSDDVELVAQTKHLQLVRRGKWSFVRRPTNVRVVCIVAVTVERKLLLVEQFRPPVDCSVLELPAGLAGDIDGQEEEELETAARRELLEETGYVAERWTFLANVPSSAGLTNEVVSMYLAQGLVKQTAGGGDGSENIVTHEIPLADAPRWLAEQIAAGKLVDSRVYAGLYFEETYSRQPSPKPRTSASTLPKHCHVGVWILGWARTFSALRVA